MKKSEKKSLIRIIAAAALLIACHFIPLEGIPRLLM